MFSHPKYVRASVTLLLAVATVVAAFPAAAQRVRPCSAQQTASRGAVAESSCSCCCRPEVETGSCCCRQKREPASPPLSTPENSGRSADWLPGDEVPSREWIVATARRLSHVQAVSFLETEQPSVQAMLCIWRI